MERFEDKPNVYFRFNVEIGLETIGLDEWKRLGEIQGKTIDYMEGPDGRRQTAAAAKVLHQSLRAAGELSDTQDS